MTAVVYYVWLNKDASAGALESILSTGFRIKALNGEFIAVKTMNNPLMEEIDKMNKHLEKLKKEGIIVDFHFDVI